jgi:hypothetical protein
MSSNVNHPSHYNAGKIEVIEFIEDQGLNFSRGNVVKYTARAGKKKGVDELEDLEKARWYLSREIELLKAAREGRPVARPNDMNPRGDLTETIRQLKAATEALPDTWSVSCAACGGSSRVAPCTVCLGQPRKSTRPAPLPASGPGAQ